MIRIFVTDPGYSLEEAFCQWKEHNFPGHVLYGVNYFEKFGCVPIFQKLDSRIGEKSRGNKNILASRFKSELNALKEIFSYKNYDAIYLPLTNFSTLICLFHFIKLIRKPVVGLIHSVNYCTRLKRALYSLYYASLDSIIFIAGNVKEESTKLFPRYAYKMKTVELMPEKPWIKIDRRLFSNYEYDFCMIGKTNRDYKIVAETAEKLHLNGIIVGGVDASEYENKYVKVITTPTPYRVCQQIYSKSKINIVALREANGIFGLTSILDSFTNIIPMIVTKTLYMPMRVGDEGYGLEVSVGSQSELQDALMKLLNDAELYNRCVGKIEEKIQTYNSEVFARQVCEEISEKVD